MEMNKEPHKEESPINTLYPKTNKRIERNHLILRFIQENPSTTQYVISQELKINYTDVSRVVRDLEYCGLIHIRQIIKNNHLQKLLYSTGVKDGSKKD